MKHKLTYITFFSFLMHSFVMQSQNTKKDSIPVKIDRYGLMLGVDIYQLALSAFDSDYAGIEFTGQYRLTKKIFLAAELGNQKKTGNGPQISYTATGSYITAGANYNLYQNWLDMENQIYMGLRYGFSTFSQTLNAYKIYDPNPYFPNPEPIIYPDQKFTGLSAQWLELVFGTNVKVYNNIFVGFSVNANLLVSNKEPENFANLYIPGFNKTSDGSFGVGFSYTVSYFIPIYKKKVIPVANDEVKKE